MCFISVVFFRVCNIDILLKEVEERAAECVGEGLDDFIWDIARARGLSCILLS